MADEGTNPKDLLGLKKALLHLVPPALNLWVSKVFSFSAGLTPGANGQLKAVPYGPFNWREKKVRRTVYIDAMERHLMALKDGQDIDEESGLPHEAHIAANCGILLDARAIECLVDDRNWPTGPAPKLIKDMTITS